jgi:hypothetical protein
VVGIATNRSHFYVATAKHVVPVSAESNNPVWMKVWRESKAEISVDWSIRRGERTDGVGFTYDGDSNADAGLLALPMLTPDGRPFLDINEVGIPITVSNAVPGATTRVAWAGYPGFLETARSLGKPTLCYFEGVVSAVVDNNDWQVLVVDGRAQKGVSGGPVWWISEESGNIEMVGMISRYSSSDKDTHIPGLCFIQPLHKISAFLRKMPVKFPNP